MKKILLLFAAVGLFSVASCTTEEHYDTQDTDTIAEVFNVTGVNFYQDSNGDATVTVPLTPAIFNSDMILLYRNSGTVGGQPRWEPIPSSYSLAQGSLEYFYDFTINDVVIYLVTNFNPDLRTDFSRNQTFRVVIVPGFLSNKSAATVDTSDYNAVVKAYGINENNIKDIKLK
jgi:hypothetical protein